MVDAAVYSGTFITDMVGIFAFRAEQRTALEAYRGRERLLKTRAARPAAENSFQRRANVPNLLSILDTFPTGDDATRRGGKTPHFQLRQGARQASLGIGGDSASCPCVGIIDPEQLLQ